MKNESGKALGKKQITKPNNQPYYSIPKYTYYNPQNALVMELTWGNREKTIQDRYARYGGIDIYIWLLKH